MADFIWSDPPTFEETNNVNKTVLNKYLTENLKYLFKRPRDVINLRDVGTFTTTSTTFVAVSETLLRLRFTVQKTTDLLVWCNVSTANSGTGTRYLYLDYLLDGTKYISSGDDTPLSNGLFMTGNDVGSIIQGSMCSQVIKDIEAGDHFLDLYWKTNANTQSLYTNPSLQFGCREV